MIRRLLVVTLIAAIIVGFFPSGAQAQSPTNKGLFISPPRSFVEVDAGKSNQGEITLANYTESPLDVTLLIEEFTVSDYSYEYIFSEPKESWIVFNQSVVRLEPGKNEKVNYTVTPPLGTTPGGKYYTIVAQSTIKNGSISSKVQVAAPIYINVKGTTTRTSELTSHSIARFTMTRGGIPFTLDVKNTGNTHYIATVKGSLSGLFTDKSAISTTHILLPGTTRRIAESIPTPLLPGIYKATYGYTTDEKGDVTVEEFVVYSPLWFYAVLLIGVWIAIRLIRRRKSPRQRTTSIDSPQPPYTSPK